MDTRLAGTALRRALQFGHQVRRQAVRFVQIRQVGLGQWPAGGELRQHLAAAGQQLAEPLLLAMEHIGDGVLPSNTGRGYVLRRLLRRVLTTLWRDDSTRTLRDLPVPLIEYTQAQFGQDTGIGLITGVLHGEEQRFGKLLTRGRKVLAQLPPGRPLTEADLAYLHETHGLPPDLVTELLA